MIVAQSPRKSATLLFVAACGGHAQHELAPPTPASRVVVAGPRAPVLDAQGAVVPTIPPRVPSVPSRRSPAVARISLVAPDSAALEFAMTARLAHEPLARVLARRTRNTAVAERAAYAVTREARRLRMSPSLLAAVLLTENRQLDSAAISSQGAVGLMQVMPMHAGSYGCGSTDLINVDTNICHGSRILHRYLVRSPSVSAALRRYNGCVRGANTPRCSLYPATVLRTAGRLRHDMLVDAEESDRRVRM